MHPTHIHIHNVANDMADLKRVILNQAQRLEDSKDQLAERPNGNFQNSLQILGRLHKQAL